VFCVLSPKQDKLLQILFVLLKTFKKRSFSFFDFQATLLLLLLLLLLLGFADFNGLGLYIG